MAIELVVSWNNISGVNDLNTAAQLIPPVISTSYLLRSIYMWILEPPADQSYFADFPYFPGGSGGGDIYTIGSGGDYTRRNPVYADSSRDWAGRRDYTHRHHRHHRRRARRDSRMDPSMIYDVPGMMSHPEMSTARAPHEPVATHADPSRRATVVDAPDGV